MRAIRIFDDEKNTMHTYFYYDNAWYVITEKWDDEFDYSYEIRRGLSKKQIKKATKNSDTKEIVRIRKTTLAVLNI